MIPICRSHAIIQKRYQKFCWKISGNGCFQHSGSIPDQLININTFSIHQLLKHGEINHGNTSILNNLKKKRSLGVNITKEVKVLMKT